MNLIDGLREVDSTYAVWNTDGAEPSEEKEPRYPGASPATVVCARDPDDDADDGDDDDDDDFDDDFDDDDDDSDDDDDDLDDDEDDAL